MNKEPLRRVARGGLRACARGFFLLSGCGTLANTRPFAWAAAEGVITEATLRDGSLVYVHLNDYVGRAAYYFGDLDPKLSWICRSALRRGDLAIDIGGNYGLVAMLAAGLVGGRGSVHVFEPQRELARLIERSSQANGYAHVRVHPIGLSDVDDELTMIVPRDNRGMGTVARPLVGQETKVVLRQGERYLAQHLGTRRPRLVKIDVEGYEPQVFTGLANWIRQVAPEIFVFEHNGEASVWDMPGLASLREAGYRFFGIPKVKLRMQVVPLAIGQPTRPRFHDLIAVHPTCDWTPPLHPTRRLRLPALMPRSLTATEALAQPLSVVRSSAPSGVDAAASASRARSARTSTAKARQRSVPSANKPS